MINVTPLVTHTSPTPAAGDLGDMIVVAACPLSEQSGGPYGFAVGVMPRDQVTARVRATAEGGGYRSLLGSNCASGA